MNKNDNINGGSILNLLAYQRKIDKYNTGQLPTNEFNQITNRLNILKNKLGLDELIKYGISLDNKTNKYLMTAYPPAYLNKYSEIYIFIIDNKPIEYFNKQLDLNYKKILQEINQENKKLNELNKKDPIKDRDEFEDAIEYSETIENNNQLNSNNTSQTKNNKELIEDYIIRINKEIENINNKNKELEAYLIKLQKDKIPININGGRIKKIKSIKIQKRKSPKQKKI